MALSPADSACTDSRQTGITWVLWLGNSHQSQSDKAEEAAFTPSAALIIIILPDKRCGAKHPPPPLGFCGTYNPSASRLFLKITCPKRDVAGGTSISCSWKSQMHIFFIGPFGLFSFLFLILRQRSCWRGPYRSGRAATGRFVCGRQASSWKSS